MRLRLSQAPALPLAAPAGRRVTSRACLLSILLAAAAALGLMARSPSASARPPATAPSQGNAPDSRPATDEPRKQPGTGSAELPATRRITFVCQGLGTKTKPAAAIKTQLGNAVDGLRASQAFGIIFLQGDKYTALQEALLPATPENKHKAGKFLADLTGADDADPLAGLELALRQHPQLIYLLATGDFPDNQAVIDKCRELNQHGKVRIFPIAFVDSGATDTDHLMDAMKQIARDSGGTFKRVFADKLDEQ